MGVEAVTTVLGNAGGVGVGVGVGVEPNEENSRYIDVISC